MGEVHRSRGSGRSSVDALAPARRPTGDKLLSPLAYPGGKSEIAWLILSHVGRADVLVEPMCGAATVSLLALKLGLAERVRLNDLDPHVAAFWTVLANDAEYLIRRWRDYVPSKAVAIDHRESLYPRREGGTGRTVDVSLSLEERAFRRLVVRMHAVQSDPLGGMRDIIRTKEHGAIIPRIEGASGLLKGRLVGDRCTSLNVLDVLDETRAGHVAYIDPPYWDAGEMYVFPFDAADHDRLVEGLRALRAKWVLSYDDHPEVRRRYAAWCNVTALDQRASMRGGGKMTELLVERRVGVGRPDRDEHEVVEDMLRVLVDGEPWRRHRTAHRWHAQWVRFGTFGPRLVLHARRLRMIGHDARADALEMWLRDHDLG